jgi:hypothetical protein
MVSLHIEKKKREEEVRQMRKAQGAGSPATSDARGRVDNQLPHTIKVVQGNQPPLGSSPTTSSTSLDKEKEAALLAAKKKALSLRAQSEMLVKGDATRARVRTEGLNSSPLNQRPGRESPTPALKVMHSSPNVVTQPSTQTSHSDVNSESILRKRRAINDTLGYDLFEAIRTKNNSAISSVAEGHAKRVATIEQMLTESEFKVVFGMSKANFSSLPPAKQQILTKELGL